MKHNRTLCLFHQGKSRERSAIVPLARNKNCERERELTVSTDEANTTLHHQGNDLAGLLEEGNNNKKKKKKLKTKHEGENMQVCSNVSGGFLWTFCSTGNLSEQGSLFLGRVLK